MKKNRILALLLVLALCLGLAACGGNAPSAQSAPAPASASVQDAAEAAPAAPASVPEPAAEASAEASDSAQETAAEPETDVDYDEVFVVVHTNDVHGFIDVEPYVKAVADDYKAQYGDSNVITVSAGDVFAGGNAVAHLYNGETIPPIMDAAGYDAMAFGNNDFNLGGDQALVLAHMFTHTKVLAANLYVKQYDENGDVLVDEDGNEILGEPVVDQTMEFTTAGGAKVGLFGLTISGGPAGDLFGSQGSVEGAQGAVDTLSADGCTVILGVGHTGWNDDLVTPSSNDVTSAQLVKEVPGIDAYVDGHTHSIINDGEGWICPETGTLVNQASCKGKCVGVMKLFLKDGAVVDKKAHLIMEDQLQAEYTPDPQVQKLVDEAWTRLEGDAGTMYLESGVFLNALRTSESPDGRSVRTDETNLGDLITDAMRDYAQADVAFEPGFTIRASVPEGKIYTINLYDLFANGGSVYVFDMTGQELLDKMAHSLIDLPAESTQFNQISGASYGYLKEFTENDDGSKTFTIIDPMVGGEPLDVNKTYKVAMNAGGPDAPEDQEPMVSGMEGMAEMVGNYLASGNATLLPDEATPDHRILPMESAPEGAVTYEISVEPMAPGGPGGPPPKP